MGVGQVLRRAGRRLLRQELAALEQRVTDLEACVAEAGRRALFDTAEHADVADRLQHVGRALIFDLPDRT